jgi:hypothetical protein
LSNPRSRSGSTELVKLSTLPIEPYQTHIYVISRAIRIVDRRPYRKWNYQVWRAAVRELDHKAGGQLNVTFDGVFALDREALGRAY